MCGLPFTFVTMVHHAGMTFDSQGDMYFGGLNNNAFYKWELGTANQVRVDDGAPVPTTFPQPTVRRFIGVAPAAVHRIRRISCWH